MTYTLPCPNEKLANNIDITVDYLDLFADEAAHPVVFSLFSSVECCLNLYRFDGASVLFVLFDYRFIQLTRRHVYRGQTVVTRAMIGVQALSATDTADILIKRFVLFGAVRFCSFPTTEYYSCTLIFPAQSLNA